MKGGNPIRLITIIVSLYLGIHTCRAFLQTKPTSPRHKTRHSFTIHLSIPSTATDFQENTSGNSEEKMAPNSLSNLPDNIQSLVQEAKSLYERSFTESNRQNLPLSISSAPGRVNLIGEHTDYTGGYVLPLAIGYGTVCYGRGSVVKASSAEAADLQCRTISANSGNGTPSIVSFRAESCLTPSSSEKWANYVKGVVIQYLPDLRSDEAFVFDMAIAGDVPLGSGLSSSASLEVATAVFLENILGNIAYKDNKDVHTKKDRAMERALRCQRAENIFCSVPCGIMDQFVSSAGCKDKLLLIDCRSLDFREVSLGNGSMSSSNDTPPVLVVSNSNVKHDIGGGEYPVRVKQCKEATENLSKENPLIQLLRDASMHDVEAAAASGALDGVILRRARHVVSENLRTVETADALEMGDWERVGKLMNESHESMRDDYEVSCKEIDILVDIAQNFNGVYGSRLTGGGFGGCTVTLVKQDAAKKLIDLLQEKYKEKTGMNCVCFQTSPGEGAINIQP